MSDEDLMRAVRDDGNKDAYGELCVRWGAHLFRYFFRHWGLQSADAQVCTVETLHNIWLYRRTFEEGRRFKPWLFRIAHNVGYDFRNRGKGNWTGMQRDLLFRVPLGPDSEDALDRLQISDALRNTFAAAGHPLSSDAWVELITRGSEWKLKAGSSVGYRVIRTTKLDIYKDGFAVMLFPDAENFDKPDLSIRDPIEAADLLIVLFHARSDFHKRVLRYRYWQRELCPSELVNEYDRLFGGVPPSSTISTPSFAKWIAAGFNNPSGTITDNDRCQRELCCAMGTVSGICRRYLLEYIVFTDGREDYLWPLVFKIYVTRFPLAKERRLLHRWYSHTQHPDSELVNAVFQDQQHSRADGHLPYFAQRSRAAPACFEMDASFSDKVKQELISLWSDYRDDVFKEFLSRI